MSLQPVLFRRASDITTDGMTSMSIARNVMLGLALIRTLRRSAPSRQASHHIRVHILRRLPRPLRRFEASSRSRR